MRPSSVPLPSTFAPASPAPTLTHRELATCSSWAYRASAPARSVKGAAKRSHSEPKAGSTPKKDADAAPPPTLRFLLHRLMGEVFRALPDDEGGDDDEDRGLWRRRSAPPPRDDRPPGPGDEVVENATVWGSRTMGGGWTPNLEASRASGPAGEGSGDGSGDEDNFLIGPGEEWAERDDPTEATSSEALVPARSRPCRPGDDRDGGVSIGGPPPDDESVGEEKVRIPSRAFAAAAAPEALGFDNSSQNRTRAPSNRSRMRVSMGVGRPPPPPLPTPPPPYEGMVAGDAAPKAEEGPVPGPATLRAASACCIHGGVHLTTGAR
mmetsp:Transcript_3069/g.7992  ORF Transcript_3069/g.7992 Transcript_3069/m.7992 type:complete len:322 (-) Transcript_3069:645-1610(-)